MDIHQKSEWAEYLKKIGWQIDQIDDVYIYCKKIICFGNVIKIQHPRLIDDKLLNKVIDKYNPAIVIMEGYSNNLSARKEILSPSPWIFAPTRILTQNIDRLNHQKSFDKTAKRYINKSKNIGISVEIIDGNSVVDSLKQVQDRFYSLYREFSKLRKINRISKSQFAKKAEAFNKKSVYLFAREKGKDVASIWAYVDEGSFVYLNVANTKNSYSTYANYLLIDSALEYCSNLGIKVFDFQMIYDQRFPECFTHSKHYTPFKMHFGSNIVDFDIPKMYIRSRIFRFIVKLLG